MLPAEEFLCGSGVTGARSARSARWPRHVAQWLGIGLAHVAVLGLMLQISPQARQVLGEIIHASPITPRPQPEGKHPVPAANQLEPPVPVLATAPRTETPPATFFAPEPPVEQAATIPLPTLTPPVFNADDPDNPPAQYPSVSRRLGEKGRVVLRVLVSSNGRTESIELKTSSGFERLDLAAREAVTQWHFVPARRGDEHVAAWVLVPVSF